MKPLYFILLLGVVLPNVTAVRCKCQPRFVLRQDTWCIHVGIAAPSVGGGQYGRPVTWKDARKRCQDLGGDLVKMDKGGKLESISYFIDQTFKDETKTGYPFWVGGERRGPRGVWYWVDDQEVNLKSHLWVPDSPSRNVSASNYIYIVPADSTHGRRYLTDHRGGEDGVAPAYICEHPCV